MILELKGIPNPKQAEFFRSTARHTAYGGARGGGKSWAMRRKLVLLALNYPGLNALIMRRTLPELRENHVIPLLKELKGAAKYNAALSSQTAAGCGLATATAPATSTSIRGRNTR